VPKKLQAQTVIREKVSKTLLYKKAALKIKLTPVVNFINILRTDFFVPTLFWQLFSSYMYVEKAAETTLLGKFL
jgi:hypothetical protein